MKRLDESFSLEAARRYLSFDAGVEIDLSKICISESGEVQPAPETLESTVEDRKDFSKA